MVWRKAKNGNKCNCCFSSSDSGSGSGSGSGSRDPSGDPSGDPSSDPSGSGSSSDGTEKGSCCGISVLYILESYSDNQKSEVEDWLRLKKQGRENSGFLFHGPVWIARDNEWYGALICLGAETDEGTCDCADMETGLGYVCYDDMTPEQCESVGGGGGLFVPGTQVFTPGGVCKSEDGVLEDGCDGLIDPCSLGCPTCLPCDDSVLPRGFDNTQEDVDDPLYYNYISHVVTRDNAPPVEGTDFEWLVDPDEEYGSYVWYLERADSILENYSGTVPDGTLESAYTWCHKWYLIACDQENREWKDVTDDAVKGLPITGYYGICIPPDTNGVPEYQIENALEYSYMDTFTPPDYTNCQASFECEFPSELIFGDATPPDFGKWGDDTFPISYGDGNTKKGKGNDVETRSLPAGPGTELKKLLKMFGLPDRPGCKCNKRAKIMDRWGVEEASKPERITEVVGWLREEAIKQKVPFVEWAARVIVKRAIRNARKAK